MIKEFRLPELGENIASGDVVQILVAPGDTITEDQIVLEIETDKATIEVPSPVAGKIRDIHIKAGQKAEVGQLIFTVDADVEAGQRQMTASAAPEPPATPAPAAPVVPQPAESPTPASEARYVPPPPRPAAAPTTSATAATPHRLAPAAPSVRRFAREIGIDINRVPGTGPGGRISIEDVKQYSRDLSRQSETSGGMAGRREPLPDFHKWGEVQREPMSSIRRTTAAHMYNAWTTIPHVAQFDKADITEFEKLRQQYAAKAEAIGGKLTPTAIILKAVAHALKIFPKFNASVDIERNEIIFKKYIHIGVAVDTERGLLVPVIRNVDQKNIIELAKELSDIAERARNRKTPIEEMQGGTFTVTNLGGIGGTYFAPIINWPEVAILGVSRSEYQPVYQNGQFVPRLIMPFSVSYDHRVIDGGEAARFMRWLANALEQPFLLSLEG